MRSRTSAAVVTLALTVGSAVVAAATLKAQALSGWTAYIAATERRMQRELTASDRFLGIDFTKDRDADRRSALARAVVIREVETKDDQGRPIDVPGALIHDWRGAILIPKATLDEVFEWVRSGAADTGQDDILKSAVLSRDDDGLRMYLKLRRVKVVTAVYNTEHDVTFKRYSAAHATSRSVATKIVELADPDTPKERELPPGQDRGFLWRWNAYWRYEQVDAGVIAECESISLSRDLPPIIGFMIRPIVNSTARESMERTLLALSKRLGRG